MVKRIIFLSFLILFPFVQNAQDWIWALQLAGTENLKPEAIKIDNNGNLIVLMELVGQASFAGQSFASITEDKKDMLLAKLDKYGHLLWSLRIGNTLFDDPKNIYVDGMGNIYITGSFGDQITLGDYTISAMDEKDAFLAKISKDGEVVWVKNMGTNEGIQKSRAITSDGTYLYVVGHYYNSIHLSKSADTTLEGSTTKNYFLAKYDMDGNLIFARRFYSTGNAGIHIPNILYLNGALYLSGYFSDTLIYAGDTLLSVNRSRDFLFMKLDSDGNPVWAKGWGGYGVDAIWDMASDGENIYLAGFFHYSFDVDNYHLETAGGDEDMFIGKFDSDGNPVWVLTRQSSGEDRAIGCAYDNLNNKLMITGWFSDTLDWGNTTLIANANREPFVGAITSGGNFSGAWKMDVSDVGVNAGYRIVDDNNNHFFVIGYFNSSQVVFKGNLSLDNTNPGKSDVFIAKYGCFEGISVDVHDAGCTGENDGEITVTPNEGVGPFYYEWSTGDKTQTVSGLGEGDYTVTVSDASGCRVVETVHINYHPPLSVALQQDSDILCYGDSTAQVTAMASDGFPPYTYQWSNGETTATITNLPVGDYTVTVTDGCPNQVSGTITVTQPDSLDVTLNGQWYTLFGLCIVHVTAEASGGTPDYQYEWYDTDGNQLGTDDNVWVLADDYYIIIVRDANGCAAGWYFYVPSCYNRKDDNEGFNPDSAGFFEADINMQATVTNVTPHVNTTHSFGPGNLAGHIEQVGNEDDREAIPRRFIEDLVRRGVVKPHIDVSPNPVNSMASVSVMFPLETVYDAYIVNTMGQVVKELAHSQLGNQLNSRVDVSNLPDGIYYLIVNTDTGSYKEKVVIVHSIKL